MIMIVFVVVVVVLPKISDDDETLRRGCRAMRIPCLSRSSVLALLDLCSQFLDTLDSQFELFPEVPPASDLEPEAVAARPSFF